ncbi:DUF418 domain-containing protein [Sphingobium limneticum]|uniref:DUF418 domain-containing protein n=1 Tax=Sphingobium limneticum TaxID=1007511 RepID=UPI003CFFB883
MARSRFGLVGRVTVGEALILAIMIFVSQLWVSRAGFQRLPQSPLEWMLRAMALGRLVAV